MRWQSTVVLVILVDAYAIIGGLIFSYLEKGNEQIQKDEFYSRLANFVDENPCVSHTDIVLLNSLFQTMFNGGVKWTSDNGTTLTNVTRWDWLTSVFATIELVGTVGYYPAAPKTTGGRVFTIFLAFIGIPLFLASVISLDQLFSLGADLILRLIATCRYGPRRDSCDVEWMMDHVYGRRRRLIYRTAIIGLVGFGLFVVIPSWIFTAIEGWTFGEALYYCFLTLVTIGFGDFVPGYGRTPDWLNPGWYRLCVACWLLIVIGWFAGTVSAIRYLAHRWILDTEDTLVSKVDDALNKLETTISVDRVGHTSVVSVGQSKKKRKWWKCKFWNRSSKTSAPQPNDKSTISVNARDQLRSNDVTTLPTSLTAAPSYTSTVKFGMT